MTQRWEDVLDHQMEVWQFWRTPLGRGYAEAYAQDKTDKYGRQQSGEAMRQLQETTFFHAEPIAIEPDMMTLIEHAQLSFDLEPLQPQDLITPFGFMYLPRPLISEDIWGKVVSYRALAWMPSYKRLHVPESPALEIASQFMFEPEVTGIHLSLYTHFDDPDHYTADLVAKYGYAKARASMPLLSLGHYTAWEFGRDYKAAPAKGFEGVHDGSVYKQAGIDFDVAMAQQIASFRTIQSIFRLMQQTITVHAEHRPDRSTRRRALRVDYPEKQVTVIYLRRPKADPKDNNGEGRDVDWKGQWLVAGYWRWQPTKAGLRQIWVSPHIKGPKDKPLIIREKRAFVLGR